MVKYMRKHHAYLPTRVDMELVQEAVSAAMAEMDVHLQSLDVMVESAREIQSLRQQMSALAVGGSGSSSVSTSSSMHGTYHST